MWQRRSVGEAPRTVAKSLCRLSMCGYVPKAGRPRLSVSFVEPSTLHTHCPPPFRIFKSSYVIILAHPIPLLQSRSGDLLSSFVPSSSSSLMSWLKTCCGCVFVCLLSCPSCGCEIWETPFKGDTTLDREDKTSQNNNGLELNVNDGYKIVPYNPNLLKDLILQE